MARFSKAWLIVVSLLAAAALLPINAAQARPSVQTWNLDTDFLAHPDMNPGPDSYGNQGVWNFMESTSIKRDGKYKLLPQFTSDTDGIAGLDAWYDTLYPPCSENGGLPVVLINTNPMPVTDCGSLRIGAGHTWVHPYGTADAVVGWRSPISGIVHISGVIKDRNPGGGNGIRWFVDRGTTTLADGKIDNGGKQGSRRVSRPPSRRVISSTSSSMRGPKTSDSTRRGCVSRSPGNAAAESETGSEGNARDRTSNRTGRRGARGSAARKDG